MTRFGGFAAAALALAAAPALASDEIDHYAAESSETIEEAVTNFVEYNEKVRALLDRDDLSEADMEEIHQYTYTIEAALAKMNEDFSALAVTLEDLHLASEDYDEAEVRSISEVYFETADALAR
ncbi:DUF6746 family protein [Rhodosalinus sp. FB01]|uniref:DUF6746 family protein n=1 Tax=Rhodosalinus sp. FB01 TaxID=3239194 RepID=UPI003524AE42